VSRPRDSDEPRNVWITTRWTPDEAWWITNTITNTGENRSQYLRRLVAADRKRRSRPKR
jgi:hypothetical protein